MPALDVVVRTLADAGRADLLFRALDSIRNQRGVDARPIVVVNGNRCDPGVLERLESRPGILLHRISEASARVARIEGRKLVTAACFAYLDDDDELIADSLQEPLEWLDGHPDCDVLVGNGYFAKADGGRSELIHIADHLKVGCLALSLLDDSWLQPGAFVCRTRSIPADMLATDWNHMEWTQLAYAMCVAGKHVHFMDVPMVLYYDTPGSMSKQFQQVQAALELLRSIRSDKRMPRDVRGKADGKYHNTLHILAMKAWEQGDRARAWRYHLASMRPPHMLRYLLFTRKLLRRRAQR